MKTLPEATPASMPDLNNNQPLVEARVEGRHSLFASIIILVLSFGFLYSLGKLLAFAPEPIGPNAKQLADAALTTVQLTMVAGVMGVVVGVLAAVGRLSAFAPARWLSGVYIWIMRGTPLLIQILFVFFALPAIFPWLDLNDFQSAAMALALNMGAYNAEAVRSGLLSVPRGQMEAAAALGLPGFTVFTSIVAPQALRVSLPPLVNNAVSLLKDSSLAYAIGVVELSNAASRVQAATFEPIPVLTTSALIYLILTTAMTQIAAALERYMNVEGKRI